MTIHAADPSEPRAKLMVKIIDTVNSARVDGNTMVDALTMALCHVMAHLLINAPENTEAAIETACSDIKSAVIGNMAIINRENALQSKLSTKH